MTHDRQADTAAREEQRAQTRLRDGKSAKGRFHGLVLGTVGQGRPGKAFGNSIEALLMIPTKLSHLLAGLIPDARIRIYPDSAHGFLFQYPTEVASDVNTFLAAREEGRAGS